MSALDPSSETQATHWSLISRVRSDSPDAGEALERLAVQYRDAIRDYIGALGQAADSDDLTQEFFARKFLRESFFKSVHRGTGSFRSFLKLCVKRFVIDHHRRRRTPGESPADVALDAPADSESMPMELVAFEPAADRAMDRAWARAIIGRARVRLVAEFEKAGKTSLGKWFLCELDEDPGALEHQHVGERLGMSRGAVTTSFYRFRARLQHLIHEELSATVAEPGEVETERRSLHAAFSSEAGSVGMEIQR